MALRPLLRAKGPAAAPSESGAGTSPGSESPFPVSVSPDGARLCLCTGPRTLACYRLATDRCSFENAPLFQVQLSEEEAPGLPPPRAISITAIRWVSNEHLAVGASTGLFRIYDSSGSELAAVRFHSEPLLAIRTFPTQPLSHYELDLWLLFDDKVAVVVPIYCLVSSSESAEPITYVKYHITGADKVTDLVVMSRQSRLLENPRRDQCYLLTTGRCPMLSFYSLAADGGNYRGLGELVTAVRKKLTRAVVGTVGYLLPSWGYLGTGSTQAVDPFLPPNKKTHSSQSLDADLSLKDDRRLTLSATVDPSERLAAVTDNLGRVLVVDVWTRTVLRLWKGHRNAQLAWIEVPERWGGQNDGVGMPRPEDSGGVTAVGLYLIMYSPAKATLQVWRMRHGARCIKTLAVSAGLQLVTVPGGPGPNGYLLTRCLLVRRRDDGVTAYAVELGENDIVQVVEARARGTKQEDERCLRQLKQRMAEGLRAPQTSRRRGMAREEEQALLDLIYKIRVAYYVEQLVALLDDEASGAGRFGPDFHRQATLMLLDSCALTRDEAIGGALSASSSGGGSKAAALTRWLHKRDRLLQAYGKVEDLRPDAVDLRGGYGDSSARDWGNSEMAAWARLGLRAELDGEERDELLSEYEDTPLSVPAFLSLARQSPTPRPTSGRKEEEEAETTVDGRLLRLVMRPLLADVFAIRSLDECASLLGWTRGETMACVGEWFLALPLSLAAQIGLVHTLSSCPLRRWAREAVERGMQGEDGGGGGERALDPIFRACVRTRRLEQALILVELCRTELLAVAQQMENRTLGEVSTCGCGHRWSRLSCQLRLCLLLCHRLGLEGPRRETVSTLDGGTASLYGMLATDLLTQSTSPSECAKIEKRCSLAQHKRWAVLSGPHPTEPDPKLGTEAWWPLPLPPPAATAPVSPRLSVLLSAAASPPPRPPLLLYFSWHNHPLLLATHRARTLAALWASDPRRLAKLSLAREHLHDLVMQEAGGVAGAVALDLLETFVAPLLLPYLITQGEGTQTKASPAPDFLRDRGQVESFVQACQGLLLYIHKGCPASGLDGPTKGPQSSGGASQSACISQPSLDSQGFPSLPTGGEVWPSTADRYSFECVRAMEAAPPTPRALRQVGVLLKVLSLLAAAGIKDVHPSHVFGPHPTWAIAASSSTGRLLLRVGAGKDKAAGEEEEVAEQLLETRKALILRGLRVTATEGSQVVYQAGEGLGLPVDWIRREHVMILLRSNQDELAEELMGQVTEVPPLAEGAVLLLRRRLSTFLKDMERQPSLAGILAALDADTCQWVTGAAAETTATDGGNEAGRGEKAARNPSLRGTHNVLLKLLAVMQPPSSMTSPRPASPNAITAMGKRVQSMATLTGSLLKALH